MAPSFGAASHLFLTEVQVSEQGKFHHFTLHMIVYSYQLSGNLNISLLYHMNSAPQTIKIKIIKKKKKFDFAACVEK